MKRCLYEKCGKEFEPNKPKQLYCCDIHRVYQNRINKRKEVELIKIARNATKETNPDSKKKFDNQPVYVDEYFVIESKKDNSEILKRIKELEDELKRPPKNPLIGIKKWIFVRQDEIRKLKNQCNP